LDGFKNLLSYNGLKESVNLLFWSEDGELMLAWTIKNHKFEELVYPNQ
jgi:hypothetical protein